MVTFDVRGCGTGTRTRDLMVMSHSSCRCSTPLNTRTALLYILTCINATPLLPRKRNGGMTPFEREHLGRPPTMKETHTLRDRWVRLTWTTSQRQKGGSRDERGVAMGRGAVSYLWSPGDVVEWTIVISNVWDWRETIVIFNRGTQDEPKRAS